MLSHFSRGWLTVTLWTTAHQSPLSMEFSRQEYCSGLPFPPPGDLPDPGIELVSLVSPAWAGRFFTASATWEAQKTSTGVLIILFFQFYSDFNFVIEDRYTTQPGEGNGTALQYSCLEPPMDGGA